MEQVQEARGNQNSVSVLTKTFILLHLPLMYQRLTMATKKVLGKGGQLSDNAKYLFS